MKLGEGQFDGKSVRFKVDNAKMEDGGLYQCKLTNKSGTVTSEAPVSIRKVFTKPEFKEKFEDSQQVPKRDCKFSARVTGIPTPTVQWLKDGAPIVDSDKYHIQKLGDSVS